MRTGSFAISNIWPPIRGKRLERRRDGAWDIEFPVFPLAGVEAAEGYIHLPKDMASSHPRRYSTFLRSQQPGFLHAPQPRKKKWVISFVEHLTQWPLV